MRFCCTYAAKKHYDNCCCICFLMLNAATTTAITKNKNVYILFFSTAKLISIKKRKLNLKKHYFWHCFICLSKTALSNHRCKLKTNTLKTFLFNNYLKTWIFVFCVILFTMLILTPISQNQVSAVSLEPSKKNISKTTTIIASTVEKKIIKINRKKILTSNFQIKNYLIANIQLFPDKNKFLKEKNLHIHHVVRRSNSGKKKINNKINSAFINNNYDSYKNNLKRNNFQFQISTNVTNQHQNFNKYLHRLPYNVILILPSRESNNDKFGLTSEKARPVIDISIEDIILTGKMPNGWINITYHDSRYWEDTLLAERHSTFGVVQAYCENRLDTILGFADAYSLATVSKISAGFGDGVPVITTTGLNPQIGSKKSYPYVTRMTGSYIQMAESLYHFIAYHSKKIHNNINHQILKLDQENNIQTNLNYKNLVFLYHDKRRAINRPTIQGSKGENADDFISSHCYFSLLAIKSYFKETSEHFKESWKSQTPHVAFDEELPRTRVEVIEWVKMASNDANG